MNKERCTTTNSLVEVSQSGSHGRLALAEFGTVPWVVQIDSLVVKPDSDTEMPVMRYNRVRKMHAKK